MASRLAKFTSFSRMLFGSRRPASPMRGSVGKHFVQLEDRAVPATFIVTNILDNQADVVGGLSLRQAIYAANGNPGFDRIEFNIPRSPSLIPGTNETYFPIVLASTLPDLTDPAGVHIDATTQPRSTPSSTRPIVQLLPDPNPGAFPGSKGAFYITGSNNVVRGFVITGFPGSAINVLNETAKSNLFLGNWINTDITGTKPWNEDPVILSARPPATPVELTNTGPNTILNPLFVLGGITLTNGANNNTIGGIIDAIGNELIDVGGTPLGLTGTIVRYNGKLDAQGNPLKDDVSAGIPITPEINRNIISGTPEFRKDYFAYDFMATPTATSSTGKTRARDLAGSGVGPGIRIMDVGTKQNLIQGNFIGTDVSGNVPIPNHNGIEIFNSASSNMIGNPNTNFVGDPVAAGYGNLIRFNENDGVRLAATPAPSELAPPAPATGPAEPFTEGFIDQETTGIAFGGPYTFSGVGRAPFYDAYTPNYLTGSSLLDPNIISVTPTIIDYDDTTVIIDPANATTFAGISAQVGEVVTIRGSNLLATNAVTFNSSTDATMPAQTIPAKFVVVSDGELRVTVPLGAATPPSFSGFPAINVFNPAGVSSVPNAVILPSPPAQIEVTSTFTPSSGTAGQTVSIFGIQFSGTTSVSFGGVLATTFQVLNTGKTVDIAGQTFNVQQIDAVVPTGAASGPITVTTPGGANSTIRDFVVESQDPPVLDPIAIPMALPGQEVTLTGQNFTGVYLVRFNFTGGTSGFATTKISFDSPTQIRVVVPTLATASLNPIQVVTNDGAAVTPNPLQIVAPPVPTVTGANPTSGPIGTFVTLNGTGFTSASRVTFSGIDAKSFTVTSPFTIKAVVPLGIPLGVASQVRVASSSGFSPVSSTFTPVASPVPTVDAIPFAVRNATVVINGTNLLGTTKVLFGSPTTGTPATDLEVLSETQIRIRVPNAVAATGSFFVFTPFNVQNPLLQPASNTYTVAPLAAPLIGIGRLSDPISGIIGSTVTVRGTGLLGTLEVQFPAVGGGFVPATKLTVVNDGEINFQVPQNAVTGGIRIITPGLPDPFVLTFDASGTIDLTDLLGPIDVTNSKFLTVPFTINPNPNAVITSISRTSAPIGTLLSIAGSGFTGTVQISFGGGITDQFEIVSDNLINVRVPIISFDGPITVSTPAGNFVSGQTFTIAASPAPIVSFSTPQASQNTPITITGNNLGSTSKVLFNDVPAEFTVISELLVRAIVPSGASPGELRVFTAGGNAPSPTGFLLAPLQAPVVSPVSPVTQIYQDSENPDILPVGGKFVLHSGLFTFPNKSQIDTLDSVFLVELFDPNTGFGAFANFERIGVFPQQPSISLPVAGFVITIPEVPVGEYTVSVYSSTKAAQDGNYMPGAPPFYVGGGGKNGSWFDDSTALDSINFLGTKQSYGERIRVVPNARPVVQAVRVNDSVDPFGLVPVTPERGVPISIRGTGFTGANAVTIAGSPIANFTVVADNLILTRIPANLPGGIAEVKDAVVQVFTPNGLTPLEVFTPEVDDLGSLQTGEEAQIDIAASVPLDFAVLQSNVIYGQIVDLAALGGTNFYGVISDQMKVSAKDKYDSSSYGGPTKTHDLLPISAPNPFQNFEIVAKTGGTQAVAVIPTSFGAIKDAPPLVPPIPTPPPPPPPPLAILTFQALTNAGLSKAPDILAVRPGAPTIASLAPTVADSQGANGQYNRVWSIVGAPGKIELFGAQGVGIGGVGGLGRDSVELFVRPDGRLQINFIMLTAHPITDPRATSGFPNGDITVGTSHGGAQTNFSPGVQAQPEVFEFTTNLEQPLDNRIVANRIFQNGLTINRLTPTGPINQANPVTFKPQATATDDGNLGIDFVTNEPDALFVVESPYDFRPNYPFTFGFGHKNGSPGTSPQIAANQGRGGINDGLLGSFSLNVSPSLLPSDPLFNETVLPTGIEFFSGSNTFNNSQYGRYHGPNNLQNFPLLQVVQSTADRTTFSTALLGKPFRSYRIDYYYDAGVDNVLSDATLDPFLSNGNPGFTSFRFDDEDKTARETTNVGAGQIYLGSKVITTDAFGDGGVSFEIFRRLPDANGVIPPQQPGEFSLPSNIPLVPSQVDPNTGVITVRSGVVTSTATDLTAPGEDGPSLANGPDGTSRFSFFKRVDTPNGSIGGTVVVDTNQNSIFDPGELGLDKAKVDLFLQKSDTTYFPVPSQSVTTDGSGAFFFGVNSPGDYGLPNGTHKLVLTLPTGGSKVYFFETPSNGIINTTIINGEVVTNQNFFVTDAPIGTPPTISDITNQNVPIGTAIGPLPFVVGDAESPATSLVVTVASSNPGFIPVANIVLSGTGPNRGIFIQTPAGVSDTSIITVTVTDPNGLSSSDSFVVNTGVIGPNTPPTITAISNQTLSAGGTSGPISFLVNDAETPIANLSITFTTSNGGVIPASSVVLGGSGANRTVTINPPAGVTGASIVSIIVTDLGGLSASSAFIVDVPPPPGTAPALLVVGADAGRRGEVNVYNPNGSFRYAIVPYGDDYTGGVRVATGDITGDGNADVITAPGIGTPGLVKIYDGVTGTFIQQFLPYGEAFKGGVYVVTGDVDGDGTFDLVTGTGKGGGPRVRVLRGGADGNGVIGLESIADFFPYESAFRGGVLVAAGDVNGDQFADIVTGTGVSGGPRVRVLDGTQLSSTPGVGTIFDFFAYDNRFRGGVFASIGDVDGDGQSEIITGTGVGGGAAVKIFKQSDFANNVAQPVATKSFFAYDPTFNGGVRIDIIDGNGDGIADIVTGPGPGVSSDVRVINYATLQDIYRVQAFEASFKGGVFVGGNLSK